jgi:hypothetical protein
MPRKQQSARSGKHAGKSKPNLGQMEAGSEKTGKEQMSHMGGSKPANRLRRAVNVARNSFEPRRTGLSRLWLTIP